mmetsp:Transcript_8569/g.9723  ORF Transcript_8569/g.9723 Transcript_8569/m.9723 type:complete len:192 (+) Transcript_8569:23-598(+)|eukprot:CAMPEP_0205823382 /NCGR_PEP_ID=MMETSP0206-20130828/16308_1 /ASSEMBLY_ACC=CAM_ASM_000279 /TAXON_ID=36767 /ORGANISM="Euplotes focardii, Strain TN1" /LENGTH=191 /DNA_ID=CAMNT_0053120501 /DNA_START=21 /DNA_END=596 /DNA_ORIENTATION=+
MNFKLVIAFSAILLLACAEQVSTDEALSTEAEPKKIQATFGKIFMLISSLIITGYGLNKLNNWHIKQTQRSVVDESFGKKPFGKINIEDIVDTSAKIELYSEDGESGVFDLLNKFKKEPETYEMMAYEPTSKKLEDIESSFISNASVRTADDLELHGFDNQQNEGYEIPMKTMSKWSSIGRMLSGQRESLL